MYAATSVAATSADALCHERIAMAHCLQCCCCALLAFWNITLPRVMLVASGPGHLHKHLEHAAASAGKRSAVFFCYGQAAAWLPLCCVRGQDGVSTRTHDNAAFPAEAVQSSSNDPADILSQVLLDPRWLVGSIEARQVNGCHFIICLQVLDLCSPAVPEPAEHTNTYVSRLSS